MWVRYNANPAHIRTTDCTIRAIATATGKSWDEVYSATTAYGFGMKEMPEANIVWMRYLRKLGFTQHLIDMDFYTVKDFCTDHPNGTFILWIDGHVVCVIDGDYYDTWDSGDAIPITYWCRGVANEDQ